MLMSNTLRRNLLTQRLSLTLSLVQCGTHSKTGELGEENAENAFGLDEATPLCLNG